MLDSDTIRIFSSELPFNVGFYTFIRIISFWMLENGEFGLVYLVSSKSYRIWLRSIRGKSLF